MSRQYDAKQAALAAYPNNREAAVDLFIGYCDVDEGDIEFELGQSIEKYIFGDEANQQITKE